MPSARPRVSKRVLTAAAAAAVYLLVLLPLPPKPIALPAPASATRTAIGSFHIHTNRSDGSGSPDDVAAAAAREGLDFIVLTDHGDATHPPEPPRYASGVLVIDAVELSTEHGHYIAIGLPQAPYPLRGEARDVVEDVRRLGGFGIVAHPDSAKPGLRWRDWAAPVDAIEWLNADTEWRDEDPWQLTRALVRYPFRSVETLGSLLDRSDATLERWDALTQRRRVVAVAGADAHARLGWRDDDANGYRRSWFIRFPSYGNSFRTFAMRVPLDAALGAGAGADAAQILDGLKQGRAYSAIDVIGTPASLSFTLENGRTFVARTNAPNGGVIALRRDGRIVAQGPLPELRFESPAGEGTYRVEAYLSSGPGNPPVPWIISNPIYVRPEGWGSLPQDAVARTPSISQVIQGGPWHVEKDDGSTGQIAQPAAPSGPVEFQYQLGEGGRSDQYAALGVSVGGALGERTHLAFRANASRPMRASVQARHPHSGGRWQRSIYLDPDPREVIVRFSDMGAVGASGTFDPAQADTILFVIDTTNTAPGTAGTVTISDLRIEGE